VLEGTLNRFEASAMKIRDDHMYHGAALIQIAEHPQFTAINSLKTKALKHENAYTINDKMVIYLKYATKPVKGDYLFTFTQKQIDELKMISQSKSKTFLVLVCVKDREICCLTYHMLNLLLTRRRIKVGHHENQYSIWVTIPAGKRFRVHANAPDTKKTKVGPDIVISRSAFPGTLFQ
jgi:hypothetical protein